MTAEIAPQNEEERDWLDAFTAKMAQPGESKAEFYDRRKALGKGVGLDADVNLTYAKPRPDSV